jgi:uncharacterized iron-regulated protein
MNSTTFFQKLYSTSILKFYVHIFLSIHLIIGFFYGCAATPKKLMLTDTNQTFSQDTIISTKLVREIPFAMLMENLNRVKVIYIGERHSDKNHHDIQLKVIKSLYEKNPALCVGLEMFDRTYQNVLDQWVAGQLDETEFLKKTHWYSNWRFNFDLYRDILLFIKENHITLIGLNIPFHIPPKIAVGGLKNLLDDDKRYLPKTINTDIESHRLYVKKIFGDHKIRGRDNFDTFYEAQCVWEDIMAETISSHLCDGPIVVLAGNGHIIYKFGIPDRAFQLKPAPFKTIFLAPAGTEAELDYADYIWVTPEPQIPHRMPQNFPE